MKKLFESFFKKQPTAREMHFRQTADQIVRANDLINFLQVARKHGTRVDLLLAADGQSVGINFLQDPGTVGAGLGEYLMNWSAAMKMRYSVELEEMASLWPELGQIKGLPIQLGFSVPKTGGAEIAPQGP
jgi:hypothetical protein